MLMGPVILAGPVFKAPVYLGKNLPGKQEFLYLIGPETG
jgi:hypothetical protein